MSVHLTSWVGGMQDSLCKKEIRTFSPFLDRFIPSVSTQDPLSFLWVGQVRVLILTRLMYSCLPSRVSSSVVFVTVSCLRCSFCPLSLSLCFSAYVCCCLSLSQSFLPPAEEATTNNNNSFDVWLEQLHSQELIFECFVVLSRCLPTSHVSFSFFFLLVVC